MLTFGRTRIAQWDEALHYRGQTSGTARGGTLGDCYIRDRRAP